MSHELSPVVSDVGGLPATPVSERTASQSVPASAPAATATESAAVQEAINKANRALEVASMSFRFAYDDATKQIVVSVLDDNTGQVIRQVPSPEQLSIAARLRAVDGLFLNQRA